VSEILDLFGVLLFRCSRFYLLGRDDFLKLLLGLCVAVEPGVLLDLVDGGALL